MKSITISAPGKLMLFGEHAVVYGHPCIVTAVDQRLFMTISLSAKRRALSVDAPEVDIKNYLKPLSQLGQGEIPKGARFIEFAVKNFFEYCHAELDLTSIAVSGQARLAEALAKRTRRKGKILKKFQDDKFGLQITTASEFASTFGFGSSSASVVCAVKALSELFDLKLSNKELFDLSYKTVLDVQGKGSGFDVAAAIYGGTLYFVTGGQTIEQITFPCHCETKSKQSIGRDRVGSQSDPRDDKCSRIMPLIISYSGIKADTVTLINNVSELAKKNPSLVEQIYNSIEQIVEKARVALEKEDFEELGKLMDENQSLLVKLGISCQKLDAMIHAATNAGAYGAKLSGAGGGDCMIGLVGTRDKLDVTRAIEKAGGEIIEVLTNSEGVRIEDQISKIKD